MIPVQEPIGDAEWRRRIRDGLALLAAGQVRPTIGLRVPNQAIAQQILQQTGPLATTSANRSGQPPLQTMAEIEAQFPDVLILQPSQPESLDSLNSELANTLAVPETAATKSVLGVPSTVAKWTGSSWTILRQGAVKLENV